MIKPFSGIIVSMENIFHYTLRGFLFMTIKTKEQMIETYDKT